jgi:hypothetical protein
LIYDLKKRIATHFQLTSDGFASYRAAVFSAFGSTIPYAQLIKQYANLPDPRRHRRYSPPRCFRASVGFRMNHPAWDAICTSHVERANLSVRLFNRRFTRLTLGYSKKLANLKHSVALFVAHFNYCRVHSTINNTPAMAAGLAIEPWSIEQLLREANYV